MKRSKWMKWQIGIVMGIFLFYLFQEVKDSPQFLTALTAASVSKQKLAPVTVQNETSGNRITGPTGSSQSQLKPHTRSQAS